MSKLFGKVPATHQYRSKFNMSYDQKLSFNAGQLVPLVCDEVLPTDGYRWNPEVFVRAMAMISPIMHRVKVKVDWGFVPMRLIFKEWDTAFITGGKTGTSEPVSPYFNLTETDVAAGRYNVGSMMDYLGFPTLAPDVEVNYAMPISALPLRAVAKFYNDYFVDPNLGTPVGALDTSGLITDAEKIALMTVRNRGWERDYRTSCLPNAQRGAEVLIPVEGAVNYMDQSQVVSATTGTPINVDNYVGVTSENPGDMVVSTNIGTGGAPARIENVESVENISTTIRELRKASRMQEVLELAMRVGSRYTEWLWGFFKQKSSDARLQRTEYLGGGVSEMVISEVLSTANVGDPVGTMSGHGYAVGNQFGFTKNRFEEHGFIVCFLSVVPVPVYQNGVHRKWFRFDRFDYPLPQFVNIGEMTVYNKEVFFDPANIPPEERDAAFGYQSQYCDWKYKESTVHGDMRTTNSFWTWSRIFDSVSVPALNEDFVTCRPDERIFAVQSTPENPVMQFVCQVYHNVDGVRPLPYHDYPTL